MGWLDWLQDEIGGVAGFLPEDIPVRPALNTMLDYWANTVRSEFTNQHPADLPRMASSFMFPFNPVNAANPATWGRIRNDPSMLPALLLNDPGATTLVRNLAALLNSRNPQADLTSPVLPQSR